jgi:tRNA threonylcarbamoyladenosine biosynthesis protein TsaB
MNLLAIDTCTEVCSVSLLVDNSKIDRFVKGVEKSSGLILSLCDEVIKQADILPSQLSGIIYTRGPGAFTGVRICVGVTQGMSFANNIPTLGFSTLEVIGYGASIKYNSKKVAVALDARMGEVYWAYYKDNKLHNESLRKPTEIDNLGNEYIGVGSGWGAYSDLPSQSGIDVFEECFYPQATNLIDLALNSIDNGAKMTLNPATPVYLRDNVAHKLLK